MQSRVLRPSICCCLVVFSTWNNWQTRCRARPLGSPPVCAVAAADRRTESGALGSWRGESHNPREWYQGLHASIDTGSSTSPLRQRSSLAAASALAPPQIQRKTTQLDSCLDLLCFLHCCIYRVPPPSPERTSAARFLFFCHRSPMITSKLSTSSSCYHG